MLQFIREVSQTLLKRCWARQRAAARCRCLIQLPRLNRGSEGIKRSQLISACVMQIFQAPLSAWCLVRHQLAKDFRSCVMVLANIGVPLLQALSCWVSLVCRGAEHPPEVHWGMEPPPKPSVLGGGPTGWCSREILGGDTLPKVDVAAVVALPAVNVLQRRLLNGERDFGVVVVLAVTARPNCHPSQPL